MSALVPGRRAVSLLAFLAPMVAGQLALGAKPDDPAQYPEQLAALRRFVACDARVTDAKLPEGVTQRWVDSACKTVTRRIADYRKRWLDRAEPFLRGLVPANIPETVVYPFGGADLLTALIVFPKAKTITTMSLEWVGDPRAIAAMSGATFQKSVKSHHAFLMKLFWVNHNRTVDLQALNHSPIPAPLVFALTALDVLGYEPLEARWFRLADDGKVVYLTEADVATYDADKGRKQVERNQFFANVELRFKKTGEPAAPVQTWRHLRANLQDDNLRGTPVQKYLESQGTIAGITKAASYLIWREDFSVIRNYMLDHMTWMISESSGILPFHAEPKGFVQETWGRFVGSLFGGSAKGQRAMRDLFAKSPDKKLDFFFGYPDTGENRHLLVTRKP
jgi:hypothetical protein